MHQLRRNVMPHAASGESGHTVGLLVTLRQLVATAHHLNLAISSFRFGNHRTEVANLCGTSGRCL